MRILVLVLLISSSVWGKTIEDKEHMPPTPIPATVDIGTPTMVPPTPLEATPFVPDPNATIKPTPVAIPTPRAKDALPPDAGTPQSYIPSNITPGAEAL